MTYISKEYEIYGTWVNLEYDNTRAYPPKVVFTPNGKFDFYSVSTATETPSHGEFVITNKWIDNKGNVWYTGIIKFDVNPFLQWYELFKISNTGKTLEIDKAISDYPKEIDPKSGQYHFYHRL